MDLNLICFIPRDGRGGGSLGGEGWQGEWQKERWRGGELERYGIMVSKDKAGKGVTRSFYSGEGDNV